MSGEAANIAASEIATVLSPTQLQMYVDCSFKWYCRYVLHMPDPPNANLAFGRAVHEAIGLYFQARLAWITLEPMEVAEMFSKCWDEQLDGDTTLRDQDDPEALRACGRTLVSRYIAEVAPGIDPIAIEEKVEGEIGGVRVQGRVDIIERGGAIRDIKTAARKPSGATAQHAFQVATYVQISGTHNRTANVDTLVKTKTPSIVQHTYDVDVNAIRATRTMYPLVQEAMRAGLYVPNRSSNLCSRNSCPYWKLCVSEFGGTVS